MTVFLPSDYQSDRVGRVDLFVAKGTEYKKSFRYEDDAGNPIDLTGCTLRSQIRREPKAQSKLIIDFQFSIAAGDIDLENGLFTLYLSETETAKIFEGKGFYSVVIIDSYGDPHVKQWGQAIFNPNPTEAG